MNKRETFMKLLNAVDTALLEVPNGEETAVLDKILADYSISYLGD